MIIGLAQKQTGVHKTTITLHLATVAATKGRTVVIDDDEGEDNNRAVMSLLSRSQRGNYGFDVLSGRDTNIKDVVGKYDNILIDTEGRLSDEKIRQLARTNCIIIPTTAAENALDAAGDTIQHCADVYKVLFVGMESAAQHRRLHHEFHRRHHRSVFNTYIPHSETLADLMSKGYTAFDDYMSNQAVAEAYRAVFAELESELE